MDIRFLESLIQVVEHGGIAAASRAQGLTAAAVSQRVRALETELGCTLLSRVGHKAVPTEVCQRLLPRAKHLIAEAAALYADIDDSGLFGNLRLGAISTALTDYVPALAKSFAHQAPNANLVVVPGTSSNLYELLVKQDIDVAVLVQPPFAIPKQIEMDVLDHQPLCLVVPEDYGNVPLENIVTTLPLILYDRQAWGGRLAWQYICDSQIESNIFCELDALETITKMVGQGLGVAFLPHWASLGHYGNIAVLPLNTDTSYGRNLVFLSHRASSATSLITLTETILQSVS